MLNLLVAVLLVTSVSCRIGIDLSTLASEDVFKCFLTNKVDFMIMRGWHSYGALDVNAAPCLRNAQAAGVKDTGIYAFPCVSKTKTAASQVSELIEGLKQSSYNRIWIDIETNSSPNCGWTTDLAFNCEFTSEFVAAIRAAGKQVGIYASRYMWNNIYGGADKCTRFSTIPLWYAHYDGKPDFSDWVAFGGWTKPQIKQYKGTTQQCGASVDVSYKQ